MKLHFTHDWLRSHIENDPDTECDAGFPLLGADLLKQFVGAVLRGQRKTSGAASGQKPECS